MALRRPVHVQAVGCGGRTPSTKYIAVILTSRAAWQYHVLGQQHTTTTAGAIDAER